MTKHVWIALIAIFSLIALSGPVSSAHGFGSDSPEVAFHSPTIVPQDLSPQRRARTDGDTIVYITDTGSKYHRSSCRYLKKSKIRITLREAKERGYSPCKVCKPPS